MSGNYKTLILSAILFLGGCSHLIKQQPNEDIIPVQNLQNIPKEINATVDDSEYKEIMDALYYENMLKLDKAYEIFHKLYKKTGKLDYLLEALKLSIETQKFDRAKSIAEEGIKKYPDNQKINEFLVTLYLKNAEFKKALKIAEKLLKKTKNERTYEYAAIANLGVVNFKKAAKYYKKAYEINNNERILKKLVTVLYDYLNKKDEAISLLETYIRINGCSHISCSTLIEIYAKEKNIKALISIYKRLYEKSNQKIYLRKITELYFYENRAKDAIKYIISTGDNEDILIDIYSKLKEYKKAYNIAKSYYQKYKNPDILARIAVLEYESTKVKDKKLLDSVIDKFKRSIDKLQRPGDISLYSNYYGYLLIDHDIDIKKGIEYVKKALAIEPDSTYYLDSLAWGYYKEGKCKEAYEIMDKIIDRSNEQEIIDHYNKIRDCFKGKK